MRKLTRALTLAGTSAALFAISAAPASAGNWQNVRLENVWSFRCLGVGSASGNGAPALQWTCNSAADEQWTITQNSAGYHTIKNKYSGKCLGVGSSTANSSNIIQWTCNGASDQQWYLKASEIKNRYSGKCIGVGASKANGANAIQYTCGTGNDQLWGIS
ncbi:RICIN domain-containing protein [Streptomyces sp. NPDC090442]|uniref:RICIN domain-containing protein n=1 Tax=Streptomyces sp. NPDC090442 TaxID=3365962 RepID=UPI00382831C8